MQRADKTAQIDYNNTKYTKANTEIFSIFINIAYRELQIQSNKCKKLPITFV